MKHKFDQAGTYSGACITCGERKSHKDHMENKHTPGPWKVSTITTTNDWLVVNSEIQVARIPDAKFDVEHGESEANAHLIAAAPDMLEALKSILAASCNLPNCGACTKARVAIAKAEGK